MADARDAEDGPEKLTGSVDPEGRLRALSAAWSTVLGFTLEELEAFPFIKLFDEGDRAKVAGTVALAAEGPRGVSLELPCRRRDGSSVWVAWRLKRDDGRAVSIHGRDVTERRVRLAETAAAERFAELGSVAASVAHDFNNVLAMISAASASLQEIQGLTAAHRGDLENLDDAVRRGAEMVCRIMDHCRRIPRREGTVDVNEVVGRMSWILRHLGRRKVVVDLRLMSGLTHANADESVVAQAVLNLAVNACDAMPNGGRLLVESAAKRLERSPDPRRSILAGDFVSLSISDTGHGIPDHARHRLFEPFFTTKSGGNGLGLYSVRRAVERCGGVIGVESGALGTRVTVYLRKAAPDRPLPL